MRLAIPKETREGETRVAATPESVKKFKGLGLDVVVQAGAGEGAHFTDADYTGDLSRARFHNSDGVRYWPRCFRRTANRQTSRRWPMRA
jgi:hypothetical protein